jgi:hypothetical protein
MNEEDSESPTEHLVMNPELWAEVQAFKALQHIPCREAVKALPRRKLRYYNFRLLCLN